MLVSYKWLKELVDFDATSHDLSEKMSTTGIEVEGLSKRVLAFLSWLSVRLCLLSQFQILTSIFVR